MSEHAPAIADGFSLWADPPSDADRENPKLGIDQRLPTVLERRDQTELQLLQAQRLENLGQIAGGVAHDFNNLLAVILNYSSFVTTELAAATESDWSLRKDSALSDLKQITLAAERAATLTHQLLIFARRDVIQPKVVSLNDVVSGLEQLLRRTLGSHIQLTLSLADDLRCVLADPGQLEQVLMNLSVNARDAMPEGGVLTIATENLGVDDAAAGGDAVQKVGLQVRDSGSGMSKEVAKRVFEPFFTTKVDGTGTGLGLAIAYGIVAEAEGSIEIDSKLGAGTTFRITLPVTTRDAVPVRKPMTNQRAPKGETILVVEDEDALREVTSRIFTRSGYRVLAAANGIEAIAIAREYGGAIHLLVTDVVMPQMLGKEVAERIREIVPHIEVLFLSGYARTVLASEGKLDANVALVGKPFTEAQLISVAGQVLDGHFPGFKTMEPFVPEND